MNTQDEAAFLQQLRTFVDKPTGAPRVGGDLVNHPMTRHWCQAISERNPIYLDEQAARAAGFPGIPAHPTLLQSWTHHDRRYPPPKGAHDYPEEQLFRVLGERGFTSVVATNSDQEYFEYFQTGDQVTMSGVILSVSPRKTTALGEGHFVTSRLEYRDQRKVLKGQLTWTVFRFKPPPASGGPPAIINATPAAPQEHAHESGLAADAVMPSQLQAGLSLAPRVTDITPTLIAVGAIDSRDFHPVHHDRDHAQATGTRDIIMNVFTSVGLVGIYVTDRLGAGSLLRRVAVRLGVPNYPGDTMQTKGIVNTVERDKPGMITAQVAVTASNSLGLHASATVVVDVPAR